MKIALLTDAWEPQVNGVVRTWQHVIAESEDQGHVFKVIHPGMFRTFPAPRYPEIRLAWRPGPGVARHLADFDPDAIHVVSEGPIGRAGRRWCRKRRRPFTSSYHTQFPQYLKQYFGLPKTLTYRFVRWFHGAAAATLVPTQAVNDELTQHGLNQVVTWSRGVDTKLFHPDRPAPAALADLPRPLMVYAGRVAVEKNLDAFLSLDLPGTKLIIGDGPARADLQRRYPETVFAGYQFGEDLAAHYAAGDVFVFPSHTDTYGVVMLEANACGLPVAAFPVTGPIDVVKEGLTGALDDDLGAAVERALTVDRVSCLAHAAENSWARCAQIALDTFATRSGRGT